jgi:hypothetical protein
MLENLLNEEWIAATRLVEPRRNLSADPFIAQDSRNQMLYCVLRQCLDRQAVSPFLARHVLDQPT